MRWQSAITWQYAIPASNGETSSADDGDHHLVEERHPLRRVALRDE